MVYKSFWELLTLVSAIPIIVNLWLIALRVASKVSKFDALPSILINLQDSDCLALSIDSESIVSIRQLSRTLLRG